LLYLFGIPPESPINGGIHVLKQVVLALLLCIGAAMTASAVEAPVQEVHVPKSSWDKFGRGDAKAGDFVEYEMTAAPGMKMRQEIKEVGDHTMTVESAMTMSGTAMPKQTMKMIYDGPDVEGKDPKTNVEMKMADEKVTVKKGSFDATRVEAYMNGALLSKSWITKEVPVTGLVKTQDKDGKDTMVLTDFGKGK
jgi:hypothetical protein